MKSPRRHFALQDLRLRGPILVTFLAQVLFDLSQLLDCHASFQSFPAPRPSDSPVPPPPRQSDSPRPHRKRPQAKRSGQGLKARVEIEKLGQIEKNLREEGNEYWAAQAEILKREVAAWTLHAEGKAEEAVAMMREAADEEDAVEKLPVTPGPIVPAREQLGYLLLEQNHPGLARKEFEKALAEAPGRRGALEGSARANEAQRQGK